MINGLKIIEDYITPEDEEQLITLLDSMEWSSALARRTQHYGYNYNYKGGNLTPTTPFPEILSTIASRLLDNGYFLSLPNQCIVNEYTKLQGIAAHIDNTNFGPIVASLSLLQPTNMVMSKGDQKDELYLPPRSLLILSDEARETWKHEIPKRATLQTPDGKRKKDDDYRRVSLTFRTIV